ncbi:MAG: hypothetical protein ACUVUG_09145 [Candidatus Aminicenantia bacterium]
MKKLFLTLILICSSLTAFTKGDEPVYFGVSRYDLLINKNFTKKDIDNFFRENAYRGANFIRIYSYFYAPFKYGDSYLGGFPNTYVPWKVVREESDSRKIFDLTQFSEEYAERLKWFMDAAKYYNITVDICILDTLAFRWDETWYYHPFNPANNIQGFDGNYGGLPWNPERVDRTYFELYMKWLAEQLNSYQNFMVELVNEAYPDSTGNMNVFTGFISWMEYRVRELFPGKLVVYSGEAPGLLWTHFDVYCAHFVWSGDELDKWEAGTHVLTYLERLPGQKILSSDGDGNPDIIWEKILNRIENDINSIFVIAFDRQWWVDITTLDYKKSYWVLDNASNIYKSKFGVYPKNKDVKKDPLVEEEEEETDKAPKNKPRKG